MVEYSKVDVKLSDTQLKKLKTAVRNKTGTTLKISLKMLNGNNLAHELLLTTKQKTKLRNAFNNNMSTDLKLSKAHTYNWAHTHTHTHKDHTHNCRPQEVNMTKKVFREKSNCIICWSNKSRFLKQKHKNKI